ncbi:MAG: flavin reductase family protein [Spirochaetota bacterium]
MSDFVAIPIQDSHRLVNSGNVILISVQSQKRRTVTTVAWNMPVSNQPKLLSCALANKRYSLELIKEAKCFCINIPEFKLLDAVIFCGTYSGRKVDKCKEANLTAVTCSSIHGFFIDECVAHIECELYSMIEAGDHTIVIGTVTGAMAQKHLFTPDGVIDINKVQLIHHLGGTHFGILKSQEK